MIGYENTYTVTCIVNGRTLFMGDTRAASPAAAIQRMRGACMSAWAATDNVWDMRNWHATLTTDRKDA